MEIFGEDGFTCKMTPFESSVSHKKAEICVYNRRDIVSDMIRRQRRWPDCDILPSLWRESQKYHLEEGGGDGRLPVYVDIGANIGSCVVEMLMETNAKIIAFEPHPMNLYNLKRTLSNLGKEYQERVRLFPIGLGDQSATNTIYAPGNNMGNSIIGTQIKDADWQVFDKKLSYTVNIERLDSILKSEDIYINLVKMDAQGFECKVLEGMGSELATKIDILKFEWSTRHLAGHECHDLLPRLRDFGFNVYKHFNPEVKEGPFQQSVTGTSPGYDREGELLALRSSLE